MRCQLLVCILLAGLLLMSCAVPPAPETQLKVAPGLAVGFNLPQGPWKVASKAPEFLVEAMTEHIAHDLEEEGKPADRASIEAVVGKRLAANEYFIFNPGSGAHMEIDFSPLGPDEAPPSCGSVADSARYAGESLGSEEGIAGLTQQVERVRIHEADCAYGLQASFKKHDVPTRFYGLIGFVDRSWFFIYYTDSGRDQLDYPQAMEILRSVQVIPAKTQ